MVDKRTVWLIESHWDDNDQKGVVQVVDTKEAAYMFLKSYERMATIGPFESAGGYIHLSYETDTVDGTGTTECHMTARPMVVRD